MLADHRAMQVEKYRVDAAQRGQVFDHHASNGFKRAFLDMRGGAGVAPDRRQQFPVLRRRRRKAREADILAGQCFQHAIAALQTGPAIGALEMSEGGLGGGERVRLVMETANGNSRHRKHPGN